MIKKILRSCSVTILSAVFFGRCCAYCAPESGVNSTLDLNACVNPKPLALVTDEEDEESFVNPEPLALVTDEEDEESFVNPEPLSPVDEDDDENVHFVSRSLTPVMEDDDEVEFVDSRPLRSVAGDDCETGLADPEFLSTEDDCESDSETGSSYSNSCVSSSSDSEDEDWEDRETFLQNLRQVNAVLRMHPGCQKIEGRYAVVGDVHGDFEIFEKLVDRLEMDIIFNKIDGVVFLGDFWDRNDGDVEVFEKLISFAASQNKDGKYRVVILRGNHETPSFMEEFGDDFKEYVEELNEHGESEILEEIVDFYSFLPFNVIINKNIYAVHGGLPYLDPNKRNRAGSVLQLVSTDLDLYPCIEDGRESDLLYMSVWLRFDDEFTKKDLVPNKRHGKGGLLFGPKHVEASLNLINRSNPGLNIRTIIRGHDHNERLRSFDHYSWKGADGEDYYIYRVITFPRLSAGYVGSVALVLPGSCQPLSYYITYYEGDIAVVEKDYMGLIGSY